MKKRKDNNGRVLREGESVRKDGRYQYRYNTIDKKRKTVYAKTLEELCEKEQEIQADLYNGFCTSDRNITVNQMFARCSANRQFLKPKSRTIYEYCYNKYAEPILGSRKIRDLKYSDMVMFFKYLLDDLHLNLSTVRITNCVITPLFKTALRDGIIKIDTIDGVFSEMRKTYHLQPNKRKAVPQEHINALIVFIENSMNNSEYLNIFLTLVLTGMRVSELCGLLWSDIDFENNAIYIRHNLIQANDDSGNYTKIMQNPKSKSGNRTIPMLSRLKEILLQEQQRQKDLPPVTYGEYSGFVFSNKNNQPCSAADIDNVLRCIVKKYNKHETEQAQAENRTPDLIESCTPHQLRHSFCSILCEQDINIKVIQEMMGHKNITTTMDIYAEITENKKRTELSRLETVFSSLS